MPEATIMSNRQISGTKTPTVQNQPLVTKLYSFLVDNVNHIRIRRRNLTVKRVLAMETFVTIHKVRITSRECSIIQGMFRPHGQRRCRALQPERGARHCGVNDPGVLFHNTLFEFHYDAFCGLVSLDRPRLDEKVALQRKRFENRDRLLIMNVLAPALARGNSGKLLLEFDFDLIHDWSVLTPVENEWHGIGRKDAELWVQLIDVAQFRVALRIIRGFFGGCALHLKEAIPCA